MRKTALIGIFVFIVLLLAAVALLKFPDKPEEVFCTQDAKLCPDGSAVGRTGPKCEFTPCPGNVPPVDDGKGSILIARIGQNVSALGVTIAPQEVLEDSRCPVGVTCVWAGRVRLHAMLKSGLGEARQIFVLGEPITTEAEEIILTGVEPVPSAGVAIAPKDYRFTFAVKKRGIMGN